MKANERGGRQRGRYDGFLEVLFVLVKNVIFFVNNIVEVVSFAVKIKIQFGIPVESTDLVKNKILVVRNGCQIIIILYLLLELRLGLFLRVSEVIFALWVIG